jgi:hypothetical protein
MGSVKKEGQKAAYISFAFRTLHSSVYCAPVPYYKFPLENREEAIGFLMIYSLVILVVHMYAITYYDTYARLRMQLCRHLQTLEGRKLFHLFFSWGA